MNKLVKASIAMGGELNTELVAKMNARFLPEAWLRYFSLVRSAYRHLFEDVPCGPTAMRLLFEAVSCVEDDVGKARAQFADIDIDEWGYVGSHVKIPEGSTRSGVGVCSTVTTALVRKSLEHAFDVSSAFSRTHRQVNKSFQEVLQTMLQVESDDAAHVSRSSISGEQSRDIQVIRQKHMIAVIDLIKRTVLTTTGQWITLAEEVVHDVQDAFPDTACSVVTRQATFALLRQTVKATSRLEQAGKFKKKESDLVTGELLRSRKRLVFNPPKIAAKTPEEILRRSPIIAGFVSRTQESNALDQSLVANDEHFFQTLLREGTEVMRNRGTFLYKKGANADGFYILLRGSVQYIHPDSDAGGERTSPRGSSMATLDTSTSETSRAPVNADALDQVLPYVTIKYGHVGHLELLLADMHGSYGAQPVVHGSPFEAWKRNQAPRQEKRLFSAKCTSIVHAFFVPKSAFVSMLDHVDTKCPRFASYLEVEKATSSRELLWRTAAIPLMFTHLSNIPGMPAWSEQSDTCAAYMEAACKAVSINMVAPARAGIWSQTVEMSGPALLLTGHMRDPLSDQWGQDSFTTYDPFTIIGLEYDEQNPSVPCLTSGSWYLKIPYEVCLEAGHVASAQVSKTTQVMTEVVDVWGASKATGSLSLKSVMKLKDWGKKSVGSSNAIVTEAITGAAAGPGVVLPSTSSTSEAVHDQDVRDTSTVPLTSNPAVGQSSTANDEPVVSIESLYQTSREDINAMDIQKIML